MVCDVLFLEIHIKLYFSISISVFFNLSNLDNILFLPLNEMLFYTFLILLAFTNINNFVIRINKIIDTQNVFWNCLIIQMFFNNQNIYLMYFFNIDGKNNKSKITTIVAEIIVIKAQLTY